MFKRRDIPPVLLLLLLIILVMLTLSQILVVHNGRYGRNVQSMRKLQLELRELDLNLHSLMMQNVPSIELNRRMLQNEINNHRFMSILREASKTQGSRHLQSRANQIQTSSKQNPSHAKAEHQRSNVAVSPESRNKGNCTVRDCLHQANGSYDTTPSSAYDTSHTIGRFATNASSALLHKSNFSHKSRAEEHRPANEKHLNHYKPNMASHDEEHNTNQVSAKANTLIKVKSNMTLALSGQTWTHFSSKAQASNHCCNSTQDRKDHAHFLDISQINGDRLVQNSTVTNESFAGESSKTNYCPSVPPGLTGKVLIDIDDVDKHTEERVLANNPQVEVGGQWRPASCVARHKVAIVIPYRDREQHLLTLLAHLHPILQKQQLDYRVIVVEQYGKDTFNKARIMNIAFVEGLKQYGFQCFVFHDVDLVPEDDRNMYSCPVQPRHMSVAIDEMGYKLAYQELVGGVLNMRSEHFQRVNGYSNLYWGWGAEDDDMAYRILHVGLKITRPPEYIARYKMIKHTKRKPSDWRKRAKLLYTGTRRFQFDGLNSLQYKVKHIKMKKLYTHFLIDIGKPPRGF